MKRKGIVTIEDVAREAGVSPASVSNAFNGRWTRMSEKTRKHILEVCERLNYTPNAVAASLRSRRSKTVGVVVTNITNPFYSSVVRSIQDAAREGGYSVILTNTDDDPQQEREMLTLLRAKQVEGILLVTTGGNEDMIRQFKNTGTNIVLLDRGEPGLQLDTVRVNNHEAAEQLITYLIELGHRRIALLSGPATGVATRSARMEGYKLALEKAGIEARSDYMKLCQTSIAQGHQAIADFLALDQPPTAVFATNTFLALGALEALHMAGRKIPNDISFTMFDDPDWARLCTPPITVVSQPTAEIGFKAFELMKNRLNSKRAAAKECVLKTELVLRSSCAPPNGAR